MPADPLSIDELLARRRFVVSLARRLAGDVESADDVAQETFARLIDAPPPRPRSLESWLRTVVQNVARQLRRREERRATREHVVAITSPATAQPTDELAQRLELQRRLIGRVLELAPIYREVVLLHFYDERTIAATAAALAVPLETVRTRLRRALAELRARWNAELGGEREGRLALLPLAEISASPLAASVFSGALLTMSNPGKLLTAAILVVVAGGGWWWSSGRAARHREVGDHDAMAQPVTIEPATAPTAIAAERVSEPPAGTALDAPAAQSTDEWFGSVRARVVWARQKTPIAGVPVRLRPEGERPPYVGEVGGMTDESGVFVAERVPVGSVIANAAGFTIYVGDSRYGGDPRRMQFFERECTRRITVEPGAMTEIELAIHPELEVDGVVLDPRGAPVAGASIVISDGRGWPSPCQVFGTTGRAGRFHLPAVEGSKFIAAFAPGFAPSPAISLDRNPLRHADLEIQLLEEGARVRGRVRSETGAPIVGALVYAGGTWGRGRLLRDGTTGWQPPAHTARTDAGGAFDLDGVASGEVHVVVRSSDHAPFVERFTLATSVVRNCDVVLHAGGTLVGVVKDEAGAPVPDVEVRVLPAVDRAPWPHGDIVASAARTDSSGRFSVDHLVTGRVEASIDAEHLGTATLTFEIADRETRPWEAILSRGLLIRGRLLDEGGAPHCGWRIETRPERHGTGDDRPPEVRTDLEGRFTITRCRQEAYELRVFESGEEQQAPYFSVIVLRGVAPAREEQVFEVPSGARSSAFVAGRILDEGSGPLPKATLYLCQCSGGSANVGMRVAGAAGFRIGPFPPGDYRARLTSPALPDVELGILTLVADRTLDLGAITMPRPGFVEVRARRIDGSPLRDEDVGIWSEERGDSAELSRTGDQFRSEPLAPGQYLLCGGEGMASMYVPFEIASGQTLNLTATVEAGWIRSFRLLAAPGHQVPARVEVTLVDSSAAAVWSHSWTSRDRSEIAPFEISQRFGRGRHALRFVGDDGSRGHVEFDVVDALDVKEPLEVQLRRE